MRPKSPSCQFILRNTSTRHEGRGVNSSEMSIKRSQSLVTTKNRVPVLAPSQGERAHIETLLADVWSHELLPFPSRAARTRSVRSKSEQIVRTSASTVMRKLSVASFSSLKRTASNSCRNMISVYSDMTPMECRASDESIDFESSSPDLQRFCLEKTRPNMDRLRRSQTERHTNIRNEGRTTTSALEIEDVSGTVRRPVPVAAVSGSGRGKASHGTVPERTSSKPSLKPSQSVRSDGSSACSLGKGTAFKFPRDVEKTKSWGVKRKTAKTDGGGHHGLLSLFR